MPVTFTNVTTDGVRHSRATFSRLLVCDTPDWVARIGSAGREHNLDTCVSCQTAKIIRDYYRDHVWTDLNGKPLRDEDDGAYRKPEPLKHVLTDKEYAFLTSRQSERIMRIAQFCPVKRIPDMLREMRAYKRLALEQASRVDSEDVTDQCVLRSILADQAANTLWQRWRVAVADDVAYARLRFQLSGLWDYRLSSLAS